MPTRKVAAKRAPKKESGRGTEMAAEGKADQAKVGADLHIPDEELSRLDVPYFNVSSVQIQATGNDFVVTFSRALPAHHAKAKGRELVALVDPVAVLSMSPQTAKDLAIALSQSVGKHEESFGELVTPYTKRLHAAKDPTRH